MVLYTGFNASLFFLTLVMFFTIIIYYLYMYFTIINNELVKWLNSTFTHFMSKLTLGWHGSEVG